MNKDKILYERALITCVVMLFVCIILKLFGVQWFNLNTSIPLLNKIDEIVMNNEVLSFIYSFVSLFINGYLICIIATKESNLKRGYLILALLCTISIIEKTFIKIDLLSMIIDYVGLFLVCYCSDKTSFKEYTLDIILSLVYQIISIFIRNVGYSVSFRGMIIGILMNIDYYIFLIITYLYLKKGDYTLCSIFRVSFSSLRTKLWKKPTQSSRTCSDKEK